MSTIYFIHCAINPKKVHLREGLIDAHLANVARYRDRIVYAGVVETEDAPFQRIVYFFKAATKAEAIAFVEGDSYTAMYDSVEILDFQQRLPVSVKAPVEGLAL